MNAELAAILALLKDLRGIDFTRYRQGTLQRRLANRMASLGFADDMQKYLQFLQTDPAEPDRLIEVIGIKVSHFFRDPLVFEVLAKSVLPAIIGRKKSTGSRDIRVWSAGCAGGEEAYSLAILLDLALQKEVESWHSYIFASDISGQALREAACAVYPREKLLETKLGILDAYFEETAEGFRVRPFLQARVQFCRDDLVSGHTIAPAESIFGTFDLVLCRNVIIYFESELQAQVQQKLCRALETAGFLVLGPSEALHSQVEGQLKVVEQSCRIWQKRG
ncbi:MAG: protein-glutamate O-methyltransferase CheR [Syntrophobacterales bacterium]|nr:MAG: protein-glutamate O-methyltransferase CheR [Syntrophobacterales bacterium]